MKDLSLMSSLQGLWLLDDGKVLLNPNSRGIIQETLFLHMSAKVVFQFNNLSFGHSNIFRFVLGLCTTPSRRQKASITVRVPINDFRGIIWWNH